MQFSFLLAYSMKSTLKRKNLEPVLSFKNKAQLRRCCVNQGNQQEVTKVVLLCNKSTACGCQRSAVAAFRKFLVGKGA